MQSLLFLLTLILLGGCGKGAKSLDLPKENTLTVYAIDGRPIKLYIEQLEHFKTSEQRDLMKSLIKPGSLVFDVGANRGKKSEVFLDCKAKVVCIEPQPRLVHQLKKKFKHQSDVFIEPVGMSDRDAVIEMYRSRLVDTPATFSKDFVKTHPKVKWDKKSALPVTTLDQMTKKYGVPELCRIDVANYEYEVLKGMSEPIPALAFAFDSTQMLTAQKCLAYLVRLGYTKFNFAPAQRGLWLSPIWLRADEILDKIEALLESHDFKNGLQGEIYARFGSS